MPVLQHEPGEGEKPFPLQSAAAGLGPPLNTTSAAAASKVEKSQSEVGFAFRAKIAMPRRAAAAVSARCGVAVVQSTPLPEWAMQGANTPLFFYTVFTSYMGGLTAANHDLTGTGQQKCVCTCTSRHFLSHKRTSSEAVSDCPCAAGIHNLFYFPLTGWR